MKFRVVKPVFNSILLITYVLISIPLIYVVASPSMVNKNNLINLVSDIIICAVCFTAVAYPIWIEIFGFGSYRFLISETGVTYKTRKEEFHLEWKDIRHIAVSPDRYGRITRNCYICFIMDDYPKRVENIGDFDERLFGAHYRRSLVNAIQEYTANPIEGLEYVPGEKRADSR